MAEIHKFVPITKAKNELLELIRQVEKDDSTIAVTKNGVPAAVILSMEKFEGLIETLDILSDEETMKSLKKSIHQGRAGKWVSYDEVFGR
ncbi:MAG: type II toxin-antitoxin system Phd/YefM family antitoxin [Deltaproteobacteria bacterium]|nr:type II toxin-antitoxin system Phd/YefM family antitoxin [Deltaproteobacteria bacterium]